MLHIINSAPAQTSALNSCLLRLMPNSKLLLIENGVYAAISNEINNKTWNELPEGTELFVLESDLEARAILKNSLYSNFSVVSYSGFVDLVEQCKSVQSWV